MIRGTLFNYVNLSLALIFTLEGDDFLYTRVGRYRFLEDVFLGNMILARLLGKGGYTDSW